MMPLARVTQKQRFSNHARLTLRAFCRGTAAPKRRRTVKMAVEPSVVWQRPGVNDQSRGCAQVVRGESHGNALIRCVSRISSALSSTPILRHCNDFMWQVLNGGKSAGKALHGPPRARTQRVALRTARGSQLFFPKRCCRSSWNRWQTLLHTESERGGTIDTGQNQSNSFILRRLQHRSMTIPEILNFRKRAYCWGSHASRSDIQTPHRQRSRVHVRMAVCGRYGMDTALPAGTKA